MTAIITGSGLKKYQGRRIRHHRGDEGSFYIGFLRNQEGTFYLMQGVEPNFRRIETGDLLEIEDLNGNFRKYRARLA